MSKLPPHLSLATLAGFESPAHALRRINVRMLPKDAELDTAVVHGGSHRERMPVKVGRIIRKGGTVVQQFNQPNLSQSGNGNCLSIRPQRFEVTAHEMRLMIDGQLRVPTGLTTDILRTTLPALESREAAIHRNNQRAHNSYLTKKLARA